jgi:hypothetical protein
VFIGVPRKIQKSNQQTFRLIRLHFFPLFFVLVTGLVLLRHSLVHPTSSFGMPNTDTEGTLWWIWSQCKGYLVDSNLTNVSFPQGFDISRLPSFNLVDSTRVILASMNGCSVEAVTLTISVFPLVALLASGFASYGLGYQLFQSRYLALFISFSASFSNQNLLSTRTSLANIFIAPGLMALMFAVVFLRKKSRSSVLWIFFFLVIQMLCNAYNGALFVFLTLLIVLFFHSEYGVNFAYRFKVVVGVVLAGLIGLIPLIQSQIYLFTNPTERDVYRPVDQLGETVEPLVLISRNYSWFDAVFPENFPRPEAGWISVAHLIVIGFSIWYLAKYRNEKSSSYRITAACLGGSFLLTALIYRIPGTSPLKDVYFEYFSPLRGVSNFSKGIPLLLGVCGASTFKALFARGVSKHFGINKLKISGATCVLFVALSLLLVDNIPRSESFTTRTSLNPIVTFWNSVHSRPKDVVAHFPDFTYGKEWGLPSRFIQLAQLVMDREVANGRDFENRASRCASLPTPIDDSSLKTLVDRGVTMFVLHRQLMVPVDLDKATDFLRKKGYKEREYAAIESKEALEIYKSLDVIVFQKISERESFATVEN